MNNKETVIRCMLISLCNIMAYICFGLNASSIIMQVFFAIALTLESIDFLLSILTGHFSKHINLFFAKTVKVLSVIALLIMLICMLVYKTQYNLHLILGFAAMLMSSQIECDMIEIIKDNQDIE